MWPLPRSSLKEVCTELFLSGVEWTDSKIAWRDLLGERVQDVVDFDEVLAGSFGDVGGCELDFFEAV